MKKRSFVINRQFIFKHQLIDRQTNPLIQLITNLHG